MVSWSDVAGDMENYSLQTGKSITSLDNKKDELNDTISKLNSFKSEVELTHPDIAKVVDFHINKFPGEYGTIGLVGARDAISDQLDTMDINKEVASSLSEIYRAQADGTDLSDISTPPDVPDTDLDDPENKPDFVFPSRQTFIRSRIPPDEPEYTPGSMICVEGFIYVYVVGTEAGIAEGTDELDLTNGWAKVKYVLKSDVEPPPEGA